LAAILAGRKLIRSCDPDSHVPKFLFAGHDISFDPRGVWPALTNPKRLFYERIPSLQNRNDEFNRTYTRLLDTLNLVFNGESDRLSVAIGLMQSLKEQAGVIMAVELLPGQNAGLTFEYIPEPSGPANA
jgi:hypothetical protein